jgi:hypothetical protein
LISSSKASAGISPLKTLGNVVWRPGLIDGWVCVLFSSAVTQDCATKVCMNQQCAWNCKLCGTKKVTIVQHFIIDTTKFWFRFTWDFSDFRAFISEIMLDTPRILTEVMLEVLHT